nr:hypothetical protein [Tanacetum cinerariifolium]
MHLMLLIVFLLLQAIVLSTLQLDKEDLEQIDQDDLEETDLKWHVAMLLIRVKRFYKNTERKLDFNGKEIVGFDKNKIECFNFHRRGHFTRDCRSSRNSGNKSRDARNAGYRGRDNGKRPVKEEDEQALIVRDGLGTYDWSYQIEEEATDFALMAFTSNPSSSLSLNSNVRSCSNQCEQFYKQLKTLFDEHREKLSKANIEIIDRMAKKSVLPTNVGKGTGHMESTPVWNNVQRINHRNKFAPTAVFTRSGKIPANATKPKAAALTSVAKPVNTDGPKQSVNFSRTISTFHKSHSPIRRLFYNATTHSRRNSTKRVNIVGSKAVNAVKGNRVTVVKTSVGSPHQALKNKEIVDSGCSRHMTGKKPILLIIKRFMMEVLLLLVQVEVK